MLSNAATLITETRIKHALQNHSPLKTNLCDYENSNIEDKQDNNAFKAIGII